MYQFRSISHRVARLREQYRTADYTLDADRAVILAESYKTNRHLHPALKKAQGTYDICANWHCRVEDDELIVCNLGKHYKGTSMWPEYDGLAWLYLELDDGSFYTRESQDEPMNFPDEEKARILPYREYWTDSCWTREVDGVTPEGMEDLVNTDFCNCWNVNKGNGSFPTGHLVPNYRKVIEKGFGAVRREAREKVDAMRGKVNGADAPKYMFYRSVVLISDAYIILVKRYAQACLDKAAEEAGETRKAELLEMADSLEWISEHPARTFWQAVQATILYQLFLYLDGNFQGLSFGRFDMYTYPPLKKELEAGTITLDQAQEIVDCFWLKASMMFNSRTRYTARVTGAYSTFQHMTIGGVDKSGNDATNPVTFLCLETPARLLLHDPPVSLRFNKNTTQELFECAFEASKLAGGIPCFQNEDLILDALIERKLYSVEDARDFALVGCQELAGSGNDYPASSGSNSLVDMNMANLLLLSINNGINPRTKVPCALKTGYLYEMKTFDDVLKAVHSQMDYLVSWLITMDSVWEEANMRLMPVPALSAMLDGCMEKGVDCVNGGCKYNSYGHSITGVGTFGESLTAIKYMVYDAKCCTSRELYDALMSNWEGCEPLRQQIKNMPHKYGNADPYADAQIKWLIDNITDSLSRGQGMRGGTYRLGLFTASSHVVAGTRAWATPDGRYAYESLSDCISPVQGADTCGPTAVMLSACCFDHKQATNGMALNIRFHPNALNGDDSLEKLRNLMMGYFNSGGMEVQYNVVSSETLRAAQKDPDKYKDLVIRIAGFSAYFVELATSLQNDLIARTENQF